ncbi:hypothetical protein GC102_22255 [Paenibacillus sp. LMG 31460]|uniref:S-layer homology domain-containing protein n=1 Tax=Paenibacillus germinis TaxID=2654979 RepID=A0ABX1Z957_9BACL|nr:S-layer homology domain-containing protein [Paenibacillus germinis]NOU88456.1 hypothetical protein [Paenibacillus germinis]
MRVNVHRFTAFILLMTMIFSYAMPALGSEAVKVELKDTFNSYAKKEIDSLVDSGIISGYADGTFQPQKAITRAELAKILVLSLGLKEDPTKAESFKDINATSWYRGYVGALVASGITQGTSLTSFSPEAKVTREELIVFFIRALGLDEIASKSPIINTFSDKNLIADWAKSPVSLAAQIGFVNGTEGQDRSTRFNPKDPAERQALARLAYEFKNHASQYVNKAKELTKGQQGSLVTTLEATNNTSIEVTFSSELTSVNKEDFSFDNNLQVIEAALKSGSKSIVLLTTSAQTKDISYKFTYKGISTDKSVVGAAAVLGFFGGGGGGGFVGAPSVEQQLASGAALDTITIKATGTYGPASGPATTVQNLIINPGPSGEITLRNINPQQLEILSGAVSSIKLYNSHVRLLKINAINNNGQSVRIVVMDGAIVSDTEVSSQAILESSSTQGTLGKIKLAAAAAGKDVTLKGNIDGEVTVEAPDVNIQIDLPSDGNLLPTIIKSLKLRSNAKIDATPGTVTQGVYVAVPNTTLIVNGSGELQNVELPSGSSGTTIQVGATANIKTVTADTIVTVTGAAEAIAKILSGNGDLQISDDLLSKVKTEAIKLANQSIQAAAGIGSDLSAHIALFEAAEKAMAIAKVFGAVDFDFTNLTEFQSMKKSIFDFRDQVNNLQLLFQAGDTALSVTQIPKFSKVEGNDIVLVWNSDRSDLFSSWGPLERPASGAGDATVNVKATLYKMAYAVTKSFVIKVKEYDSEVVAVKSLRSDLLLVQFDHPVMNSQAADYQFDHGLEVVNVTQYPQLKNYVLLTVREQISGTNYQVSYKHENANVSFIGSVQDTCSSTTCPMPSSAPIPMIPLPGVNIPGFVVGFVYENTESGLKGIPNATVGLIGTNKTVQTNNNGFYSFDQVSPGNPYSVHVTKTGYSTSTTNDFVIGSGEPYAVGPVILHTAPKIITGLQASILGPASIQLSWSQYWVDAVNGITYKVYKDGTEIASTPWIPLITIDSLQANQSYNFSVKACNDMGCSEPTAISVKMPQALQVAGMKSYSVTDQVYSELIKTPSANNRFVFSNGINADYLLVVLMDSDFVPIPDAPLLKGTLDISEASIKVLGLSTPVTGELITNNGITYYKISFSNKPVPIIGANIYNIHGLKYTVNGQISSLQDIQFTIVFE